MMKVVFICLDCLLIFFALYDLHIIYLKKKYCRKIIGKVIEKKEITGKPNIFILWIKTMLEGEKEVVTKVKTVERSAKQLTDGETVTIYFCEKNGKLFYSNKYMHSIFRIIFWATCEIITVLFTVIMFSR